MPPKRKADAAPSVPQPKRKRAAEPPQSVGPNPERFSPRPGFRAVTMSEFIHEWLEQYYQGQEPSDFPGIDGGELLLRSPLVTFTLPFEEKGSFEIMTGLNGPGKGCVRLIRGRLHRRKPFWSQQVIVTSEPDYDKEIKSDGMLRVIIIPTDAAGAENIQYQRPQIVHFRWPDRKADHDLEWSKNSEKESENGPETYLSVWKRSFDKQLSAYDKEVVLATNKELNADLSASFKCTAYLSPVADGLNDERVKGSLFFLSTGIFWFSDRMLYFHLTPIKEIRLIFIRDLASKKKRAADGRDPIVAVDVVLVMSEPFFRQGSPDLGPELLADAGDAGNINVIGFEGIKEFKRLRENMGEYAKVQKLKLGMLQKSYYNYRKNQLATGWEALDED